MTSGQQGRTGPAYRGLASRCTPEPHTGLQTHLCGQHCLGARPVGAGQAGRGLAACPGSLPTALGGAGFTPGDLCTVRVGPLHTWASLPRALTTGGQGGSPRGSVPAVSLRPHFASTGCLCSTGQDLCASTAVTS